ncbi:helicase C-terminal domain-containing protein [Paenibacillus lactis]
MGLRILVVMRFLLFFLSVQQALTSNNSFSSMIAQWRLDEENVIQKRIRDSFQYDKQALIYVPEHVFDPRNRSQEWIKDQIFHIKNMLSITEGRSLILSTSKQHMSELFDPLKEICDQMDVTLFRQEQGGVEKLTQQFKNDETSVLLGSGSFFSGFSVPGSSLVSVIFSRLPFPVPDDPYLKLIGEGLEDVFMQEVLFPNMMVKLNQGVGRLIRDIKDYGIITILDPRVFSSDYGSLIQADFEEKGYKFTRSLDEVRDFYKCKLKNGSQASYIPYSRSVLEIPSNLEEVVTSLRSKKEKKIVKQKTKKHKITPEQFEFARSICKERDEELSSKLKFGEDLYKYLVDLYYVKFQDISPVREHFPYINESQRIVLSNYYGEGTRVYQAKKCTEAAFGCTGDCCDEKKAEITSKIETCGGKLESIYKGNGHCWLRITPYEKNDEILSIMLSRSQIQH